jgi:HJR/Mrr/RecB family endonuclease
MKKIYISSSSKNVDDFFVFNLKRDLIESGNAVVNNADIEFYDEPKITPEYLISQADIFIAIIKDKNPFVFYELGYATALGKKVLISADSEFDMPFGLKNYNYIRFDSTNSNSIFNIINFINNAPVEEPKITEHVSNLKDLVGKLKNNPQIVDSISGPQLEELFFQYFQNQGIKVDIANPSSDYGFDLIIYDWKSFRKTIVEIKKYNKNSKVSVNTIQQLIGAMNIYDADHAIAITTSEFTSSAKDFAMSVKRPIELWDIHYLINMIAAPTISR